MEHAPLVSPLAQPLVTPQLPATATQAMARGARGRCPRCGDAPLFRRFLKPAAFCHACGQDWTPQQADDFPAYVSIIVTGHLLAPIIIALVQKTELSSMALIALIVPLTMILMIGLLQPAKGAIIALQWWYGMHGFKPDRLAASTQSGGDDS